MIDKIVAGELPEPKPASVDVDLREMTSPSQPARLEIVEPAAKETS